MSTHRHKAIRESDNQPMTGMCDCPGCAAAFSRTTETCACGAERTICHGMGRASDAVHRAHGYMLWRTPDEEEK